MRIGSIRAQVLLVCALVLSGCASRQARPATAPAETAASQAPATFTAAPQSYESFLNARLDPPPGWRLDIKSPARPNLRHAVWVSPSGKTAFGVMRFSLPMPLPHDPILWVFLSEMRRAEGEAEILSKVWDKHLPGLRFEVEGGRYRMRSNFRIRGLTGWIIYAGTLRAEPVAPEELAQAEAARESTQLGAGP